MKRMHQTLVVAVIVLFQCFAASAQESAYSRMSVVERDLFVKEQSARIARELSGREYQFTNDFVTAIRQSVDNYAVRVGNNVPDRIGKSDLREVYERGKTFAPRIGVTFTSRNLSPLFGIYIPMVESEYVNLQTANTMGALGMFQFLPTTGQRYGLSKEELLDVDKAADAAARYITDSLTHFNADPMKEALALLSYNRGRRMVSEDLASVSNKENAGCSICALTAASSRLDQTFQDESVYYVPRFFAAAIIGENPTSFGLTTLPLSTYR